MGVAKQIFWTYFLEHFFVQELVALHNFWYLPVLTGTQPSNQTIDFTNKSFNVLGFATRNVLKTGKHGSWSGRGAAVQYWAVLVHPTLPDICITAWEQFAGSVLNLH